MKKVYIWGVGDFVREVLELIDLDKCQFCGFLDKNKEKIGLLYDGKYMIKSIEEIKPEEFDYIVCTIKNHIVVQQAIKEYSLPQNKIISYWNDELTEDFFDPDKVEIRKLKNENELLKAKLDNAPYEYGYYKTPRILPGDKLLEDIITFNKSLVRFGDGEFEVMRMKERPWFQNCNVELSQRLKEVIKSQYDFIEVAIADNFGNLDKYTEASASEIRNYMSLETRAAIMDFLDENRIYGDTYVTRPYLIYKDKDYSSKIFTLFKKLWADRKILMVEGKYTRMGIGNDLFDGAKSVRRIICPAKNSYDKYDHIYHAIQENADKDDLILISLGPAATVLAFDLAVCGFQAIDIGQLDNEYEWSLRKAETRVEIPDKMVSELSWCRNPGMIDNELYERQIIEVIE